MTDHGRRTFLRGLGAGAATTGGASLFVVSSSATTGDDENRARQSELTIDRMLVGHYESDGEFEPKNSFEFSVDPRTGADVKFELSGIRPSPDGTVRLAHSVAVNDSVSGRFMIKSGTTTNQSDGGSGTLVMAGRPVGTARLFNTAGWDLNTHFAYGMVMDVGAGGVVDSAFASIDPA